MLAYRHAFHAGNHADVLKHLTLLMVLRYMNGKEKAYRYVDTHSGAGGYSLEGQYAQKKGEYEHGIARLWSGQATPPPALAPIIQDYLDQVRAFNPQGALSQYPGSPALALQLARQQDQLRCFELHPTDHRILESFLAPHKNAQVVNADGFEALKSQLPPPTRRAVVLMDPSYELNADYSRVVGSLRDAVARFEAGVYIVWYPQVQKVEAAELPRRLQALAPKGWLHARLTVQRPDSRGFGLAGSGVFVLNPPYTLREHMAALLPYLKDTLAQYDGASYLLDHKE
jgi:23S rRNA (adenine2030-N6)-methyltransferase